MSSRPRAFWASFVWVFLLLVGLAGCGVGGDSVGSTVTPVTPPAASTPTVTLVLPGSTFASESGYEVTFTASAVDPNPGATITSFTWNFGDNSSPVTVLTSADPLGTAKHTFTGVSGQDTSFTVTVTATDSLSLTSATGATATITVPQYAPITGTISAPLGSLNIAPTEGYTFRAQYDATKLLPGVTATSYVWDFGDGTTPLPEVLVATAADGAISHTFANAGTYAVKVAIKDSLGNTGLASSPSSVVVDASYTNQTPVVNVTNPATPTSSAFTSKDVDLGFTLQDGNGDTVTYTVDWGDATPKASASVSNTQTEATVSLKHAYADSFTTTTQQAIITIDATDNRGTAGQAVQQTRTVNVSFNQLPTATITTPQGSGTLPEASSAFVDAGGHPLTSPVPVLPVPGATDPNIVVIPLGGKLTFDGTSTLPGSGDAVTYSWSFPGGSPSSSTDAHPGQVSFSGNPGALTANLVTFTVADPFGRSSDSALGVNAKTYKMWVVVDGTQTQYFTLSFLYRTRSDMNASDTFDYVRTAANGLEVPVQIFQDGLSNSYPVTDSTKATIEIPVRSNLSFWVSVPKFGNDFGYIFRIPNNPTADTTLGNATPDISKGTLFGFANASVPYNPTLQIVTAAGFAAETASTDQRRIQGSIDLANNVACDLTFQPNLRWLDRLSVPAGDPLGANNQFVQSKNNIGAFSGLKGYQSFGEWWMSLKAGETMDFNTYAYYHDVTSVTDDDRRKAATEALKTVSAPNDMGFVIDSKYNEDGKSSEHFSIFGIQAYRAPASNLDPYDFDSMVNRLPDSLLDDAKPTPLDSNATAFIQSILLAAPGSAGLQGGLSSIPVPYNANDTDRKPYNPTTHNPFLHRATFSYAEYLWSKAFARPLVLNRTSASWFDTSPDGVNSFLSTVPTGRITIPCSDPSADTDVSLPKLFYSAPTAAWPKLSTIFPDNSAFDLSVSERGTFDASSSPVAIGSVPGTTGVGRFFWTAFNPNYNAAPGSLISRTWQANGAYSFPTTFTATATDPVSAWGFVPPQDTMVDKRGRNGDGSLTGATLGGYRIQWFNPTVDMNTDVVPPDFWVVELAVTSGAVSHFLLPGGYPAGTGAQSETDSILTDARMFLPSKNAPPVGANPDGTDTVAPGYCWFDVPYELRPPAGSSATVTIYALRSVLKDQAGYRQINRPEWIESLKTATAPISVKPGGIDVSQAHKVSFNYPWDIVVVNGPATPVAP